MQAGELSSSIQRFAEILAKEKIVRDISPLHSAAAQVRNCDQGELWKYSIDRLLFSIMGDVKSIPHDIYDLQIALSIDIEGKANLQPDHLEDPLVTLSLELEITGKRIVELPEGEVNILGVSTAIHLDRHNYDLHTEFDHPIYHFQYGGKFMKTAGDGQAPDFGQTFFLDTPRVSIPPFDIFLGIDFVLGNFLGKKTTEMREDRTYQNIVRASQNHLWRPYFTCLADNWGPNGHMQDWNPQDNFPGLLQPD